MDVLTTSRLGLKRDFRVQPNYGSHSWKLLTESEPCEVLCVEARTTMLPNRAAAYEQPTGVQILIISSYLYLLNVVRSIFHRLFNCGLIGEVALGIIYGTPLAQILSTQWEQTFWYIGYIGLVLIVFEGLQLYRLIKDCL